MSLLLKEFESQIFDGEHHAEDDADIVSKVVPRVISNYESNRQLIELELLSECTSIAHLAASVNAQDTRTGSIIRAVLEMREQSSQCTEQLELIRNANDELQTMIDKIDRINYHK
jgi:hypothetical protein